MKYIRHWPVAVAAICLFLYPVSTLHAQDAVESAQEAPTTKYLPVVLVHGIMSDGYAMIPAEKYINKHMPGTYVKNVTLGAGKITSFCNMYNQVEWLRRELQNDPQLQDGCNIIAHSQGGLIARYFVQRYNKPRVYNYISWGSPQSGVFGTPGRLDSRFAWLNLLEVLTYRILYSALTQRYVSFASYWRDTLHYNQYLKGCRFLPYLNNEVRHSYAALFKENICRLQNMVLVASTAEEIIEPVASCHFGFYKVGSVREIEDLFDSRLFTEDLLGLRTLQESDRLHLRVAHCTHGDYQEDRENFLQNTLPFLMLDPPVGEMSPDVQAPSTEGSTTYFADGGTAIRPTAADGAIEEIAPVPLPVTEVAAAAWQVATQENPAESYLPAAHRVERMVVGDFSQDDEIKLALPTVSAEAPDVDAFLQEEVAV